uniref:Uncharacterized protein n=1 Tax=Caenorhabditis japonica TaxID=281687 RepID=A0A8R1IB68_CAEJA
MGQVFSSSSNSNKTPASTPQKTPNCVDPRSPTKDIERTPITVNSTTANDENSFSSDSVPRDEKPRKMSLRQMVFERKRNSNLASVSE